MNKFNAGFTVGFLVSMTLAVGYSFLTKPISTNEEPGSVQKVSPTFVDPNLNSKSTTSQPEKEVKLITSDFNDNKIPTQTAKTIEPAETETLGLVSDTSPDQNDLKKRILNKLDSFDHKDLTQVEHMLNRMHAPSPQQLFKDEEVDSIWAEQKQVELEYSYYSDSNLKEIGDLESIHCKSQHCQVKVQILKGEKLKPSYYMDWSNPVSVRITPNQNDEAYQTIEIYIPRKGKSQ